MSNAEIIKYNTYFHQLQSNHKKPDFVSLLSVSKISNIEKQKANQVRLPPVVLPQIQHSKHLKHCSLPTSSATSTFPSIATAVSITGLLPDYKQFLKSELTRDSVKLASFGKRLGKLKTTSHARTTNTSESPLYAVASILHRKKLPKLVLSAGDSSSDASIFEQQSFPLHLSLTQPTKSQSLPGLEKLKQFGHLPSKSTSAISIDLSECNEGMNSSKQQQKRLSQHFERSMRITEQRSYAQLTSSFEVPAVGRVSVARKTQLRSTKSFHGDAGNVISDVAVRASHVGDREKTLSNGYTLLRQPQPNNRKTSERQRNKILKPISVSKNQSNMNKELGQEFCSAILPDSSTASYRLTHDVSFDEGSRYRGAVTIPFVYKNGEEARDGTLRRKSNYSSNGDQRRSPQSSTRIDLLSDHSNRRPPTSHIQTLTFKEPISYSFLRADDRRSTSRVVSPHTSSPTYYQSASNGIPLLRTGKDARSNWNSKYGDLSISGGNFCGSASIQSGGRVDSAVMSSVSVNPVTSYAQKITYRSLSREKSVTSPNRSRFSSKCRADGSPTCTTSCKDCVYADPYIGASPSFHQRLNELSLLEAETIKYEKNRKFKRKPKSDKDS